ncbi:MAG: hypothetical protein AB9872_09765 [Solidesulfovibrio sp.]
MRCESIVRKIRMQVLLFSACALLVLAFGGAASAATKIPVELDVDVSGAGAEDFGQQIEKFFRASDFYVLDKKRVPRVGVSINAVSKGDHKIVTYAIVLTVTTAKCPQSFVGTIFGDNTGEEPAELHKNLDKAIMKIAKDFNL